MVSGVRITKRMIRVLISAIITLLWRNGKETFRRIKIKLGKCRMELGEEKLPTIIENSTLTELTNWLKDEEINVWAKEVKERSSFNYEIFSNFFCFYHEINFIFSYWFLWQFLYHSRNNLIFLKNKRSPAEGYSSQNLLLFISGTASSAKKLSDKKWENLPYPRICPWTLAVKSHLHLQCVNRLCIKEDRLFFLLTAQYEVLVSQQTTEVSCQWSLKLKVPICKYRTELFHQHHLREILFKCLQNSYWCMVFGLWSWQGIWRSLTTLTFV